MMDLNHYNFYISQISNYGSLDEFNDNFTDIKFVCIGYAPLFLNNYKCLSVQTRFLVK